MVLLVTQLMTNTLLWGQTHNLSSISIFDESNAVVVDGYGEFSVLIEIRLMEGLLSCLFEEHGSLDYVEDLITRWYCYLYTSLEPWPSEQWLLLLLISSQRACSTG